ncbi:MAG: OmpA family protein [Pseudomonadales bacterium]|jgi:flagellar motor protein MotB|nr:OmpA family protein [Pseudomonadales bacterium]
MKTLALLSAFLLGSVLPHIATAQDHPLVGRYDNAKQGYHNVTAYDEVNIITGKINERDSYLGKDHSGAGWVHLEGKITLDYYLLPDGRSPLEAQRNYEESLKAKGFEVVFTCSAEAGTCFQEGPMPGLSFGMILDTPVDMPKYQDFIRNYFLHGNARYLYAKLNRPEGTAHVSIAFSDDSGRERLIIVRVVETTQMETGLVKVVGADDMASSLQASGNVNLYGILFDFDKADIKPESQPQLEQIANLLKNDPSLKLDVVGHTDNQGDAAYNLRLSDLRAFAVVAELVTRYGIDRSRLNALGKGLQQPVASNADEAGRAQNRRVELVKR